VHIRGDQHVFKERDSARKICKYFSLLGILFPAGNERSESERLFDVIFWRRRRTYTSDIDN